jgi:hypothetical protein
LQDPGKIEMCLRKAGPDPDGTTELIFRLVVTAQPGKGDPQSIERESVTRIEVQQLLVTLRRFFVSAASEMIGTLAKQSLVIARVSARLAPRRRCRGSLHRRDAR